MGYEIMKGLKKITTYLLASAIFITGICGSMTVFAAEEDSNVFPIEEGVHVYEDETSPTGYTTVFGYRNDEAEMVILGGDFGLYYLNRGCVASEMNDPSEKVWEIGMFPMGQAQTEEYYEKPMVKDEETGLWTLTLYLPNTTYHYLYVVDPGTDNFSYGPDPANLPLQNPNEDGGFESTSHFYVPFDSEKQVYDRTYQEARTDDKVGTVSFESYTDINGDSRYIAVYTPYGFDVNREEPYKCLYLLHGGGGNECEWINNECMQQIMDNYIADGLIEDTVVVSVSYAFFGMEFDKIGQNILEAVAPFMVENYNVSEKAEDRALAGESMGGMSTSTILSIYPDEFSYFGVFSAANSEIDLTGVAGLDFAKVMVGTGTFDMGRLGVEAAQRIMVSAGVDVSEVELVPGAHDFQTDTALFNIFVRDYLWK